ncbi:MAG: hypothetical protein AB7G04_07695 [Hyphomonadaceae bacterium]
MKALHAAAIALFLTACATATPYQPKTKPGGYGFSERQIETNRYALSFSGNSLTDREQVEDYMLYRAAELTLKSGYDYFVLARRGVDKRSEYQSFGPSYRASAFWGYRYYHPRFGWAPLYDPFWNDPANYREISRYEATGEIAMFRGPKPANEPSAFDAREVETNLGPRVARPPAA